MDRSIFSSDHHAILQMLSNIADFTDDPGKMCAGIIKLKKKMLWHIFREETLVFPASELFAPHAIILGLLTEHAGMVRMIDKILSYMENGDMERASDRLAGLNRLILVHFEREEISIYKVLEESGTIHEMALRAKRKRLPKGWKPFIAEKYDSKA
jgi:hemerythrin superfamily protein